MSHNIRISGVRYFQIGLNVTCLSYLKNRFNHTNIDKAPSHKWRILQITRQLEEELKEYPWDFSSGIGCVLGFNDLRCIDIDNCSDIAVIKEILIDLSLPKDYQWVVKTPNGFHIYVKCDSLPMTIKELQEGVLALKPNSQFASKFERLELRWAGHCVLPGNGPVSQRYYFAFDSGFYVPQSEPHKIQFYGLFKVLTKLCGDFTFHTPDQKQYSGKIEIGNYVAKLTLTSGGGLDFAVKDRSDRLILRNYNPYVSSDVDYRKKAGTVFLDIETTGLIKDSFDYSSYPRIIQIAFKKENEAEKYSEINHYYIEPSQFTISDEVEKLTGLSESFLRENGFRILDVMKEITLKLGFYIDESTTIVSHNADFDLSVIDSEYMKINPRDLNLSISRSPFRNGVVFDTMLVYSKAHNCKYPTLNELYQQLFDEEIAGTQHNAIADISTLEKCYKLMKLYGY